MTHASAFPSPSIEGSSGKNGRRSPRGHTALLVLGVTVFFVVRSVLVIVPAAVLGVPRLGDDGLIYLWKGALNRTGYGTPTPSETYWRSGTWTTRRPNRYGPTACA